MQLFPCPFCGPREEPEFHFGAEPSPRPEGERVSDEAWTDYLHMADARVGTAREVWVHLTCGTFFVMERDTLTQEVLSSSHLPGGGGA